MGSLPPLHVLHVSSLFSVIVPSAARAVGVTAEVIGEVEVEVVVGLEVRDEEASVGVEPTDLDGAYDAYPEKIASTSMHCEMNHL